MGHRDPRIDAYIAASAGFARPILSRVREIGHEACPEVVETMKWSSPSFVYAGSILAGMAAFKQHASFGFWKHALVLGAGAERDGMGSYGKMASLKDVPPKKQLIAAIRKAMRLNEEGVKTPAVRKAKSAKAKQVFDAFAPSCRREYIEWITEAKREETRARRVAQAVEWIAEGKQRHWKYQRC